MPHNAEKYPRPDSLKDSIELEKLLFDPIYDKMERFTESFLKSIKKNRHWRPNFQECGTEEYCARMKKLIQEGLETQEKFKGYTLQEFLDLQKADRSACAAMLRKNEYWDNSVSQGWVPVEGD